MKTLITILVMSFALITASAQVYVTGITTDLSCHEYNGAADGQIDISVAGGISPYTYSWTTVSGYGLQSSSEDQFGLSSGTYSVVVTDSSGDTAEANYTLSEPTPLQGLSSATDLDCNAINGPPSGEIDITISGGTAPYTYSWIGPNAVPTEEDQTSLVAGTYDLTVTDSNGCITIASFTLSEPTAIEVTGVITHLECNTGNGAANGEIDLTVTGGMGITESDYSYAWFTSDGSGLSATDADQNNLDAGTYCVVVTDANGCTSEECWTLSASGSMECTLDSPIVGIGGSNVLCAGELADLHVTASGGTAPYTYSLDGGATNQVTTNFQVTAGTYAVYVFDDNGCQATCEITITEPESIETTFAQVNDECQRNEGEISLIFTNGGKAPYVVTWTSSTGGSLDQATLTISDEYEEITFTGAQGGETYIFSVVDANGCEISGSTITIEGSATGETLIVSEEIKEPSFGSDNGYIDVIASGGTPAYSYNWDGTSSFSSNEEDIFYLGEGTYTVTITDRNGCTVNKSYNIGNTSGIALSPPELCLVTNEINTGKNVLLWESPTNLGDITKYHIYREGLANGHFVLVGKLAAVAANRFVDKYADPAKQAYRYQVRAADNDDNESEPSNIHKTVHLLVGQGLGGTVNLSWDNYEGLAYDQVVIYRGTSPADLQQLIKLPSSYSSFTDLEPLSGSSYYQLVIPVQVDCNINRAIYNVRSNVMTLGQLSSTEELSSSTKIYPNPAQNIIYIDSEKNLRLSVKNYLGQLIFETDIIIGKNSIESSVWHKGNYLFQFSDENNVWMESILIEK